MSTYEERLSKARAYSREWTRSQYKRQRAERLAVEAGRTPSLPSVSILSSDIDVTVQDYRAGLLARREARL